MHDMYFPQPTSCASFHRLVAGPQHSFTGSGECLLEQLVHLLVVVLVEACGHGRGRRATHEPLHSTQLYMANMEQAGTAEHRAKHDRARSGRADQHAPDAGSGALPSCPSSLQCARTHQAARRRQQRQRAAYPSPPPSPCAGRRSSRHPCSSAPPGTRRFPPASTHARTPPLHEHRQHARTSARTLG